MNVDIYNEPAQAVFSQSVFAAVDNLKHQLQHDYERAYPELHEIIHLVLDEEESRARSLTSFPHLLLPDLVEAHVAKLNLRAADTKHADVSIPVQSEIEEPALALCA